MNIQTAARRRGFLVRTSRSGLDRYWLVDASTGRLASPTTGETKAQIEAAIRATAPREGTAMTTDPATRMVSESSEA